jgi:hypothetical protein
LGFWESQLVHTAIGGDGKRVIKAGRQTSSEDMIAKFYESHVANSGMYECQASEGI